MDYSRKADIAKSEYRLAIGDWEAARKAQRAVAQKQQEAETYITRMEGRLEVIELFPYTEEELYKEVKGCLAVSNQRTWEQERGLRASV
jgi:hypothetical protein